MIFSEKKFWVERFSQKNDCLSEDISLIIIWGPNILAKQKIGSNVLGIPNIFAKKNFGSIDFFPKMIGVQKINSKQKFWSNDIFRKKN